MMVLDCLRKLTPSASLTRMGSAGLAGIILGVAVALLIGNVGLIQAHGGEDLAIYQSHTRLWLAGGSFYDARQLGGPYLLRAGDSLYPPPFAVFMLPWLILPSFLWWVGPAIVIGYAIIRHRPATWTWPLMALCVASPRTLGLLVYGNPTMWVAAAVAAGTIWQWPAVFAILKPTLAPFALIGIRSRSWWVVVVGASFVSLAMLPDWSQYLTAMSNLTGQNLTYSLMDIPFVSIGVIAWLGRDRSRETPAIAI